MLSSGNLNVSHVRRKYRDIGLNKDRKCAMCTNEVLKEDYQCTCWTCTMTRMEKHWGMKNDV